MKTVSAVPERDFRFFPHHLFPQGQSSLEMKVFIFSAWSLPQLRTHYFSWDRPSRSGAGNVGKGCTQGPSFELETSIMARHSSSTTAGQAAGLAYSIFPQSKGFQATFGQFPKETSNTPQHPRGWNPECLPRDPSTPQSILAPHNVLCSTLKCTQDRGRRSQVSPTALQNIFNIFLEPPPAYIMVWLRRLGGWGLNTEQFGAQG